ncbi:MAG: type I secretion C-terminal target domain-containing protein, partial [Desulfobulbaceae bacterium]|nr:type I secretion C-terminal target domain-containing protein [Desulfobulbaceae bacterium]
NDGTNTGGTVSASFSRLVLSANAFSATVGTAYKISAITALTEEAGEDLHLFLPVIATDGDGDQIETSFMLTFDADGNITGTDANEVISGVGVKFIDGGDGNDTVSYEGSTVGVTADLSDSTHFTNVENLVGSDLVDHLTGDSHNNIIEGGAGADFLNGGSDGNDALSYAHDTDGVTVDLGTGTGIVSGGDAQGDTISNFDNVIGGSGDDTITGDSHDNIIEGGAGADKLDGGSDGNDTLSYAHDTHGVTVDLGTGIVSGGDAQGDTISNFDNVIGGSGNDHLTGDGQSNILSGGDGHDTLVGGGGNDTLIGGSDDDTLTGGTGADRFVVGDGNDTIVDYHKAEGDVVDISDVFDNATDHLAVTANSDGTVHLSILDGGDNEIGSVSFDNIEHSELTPGDELNSLLGQVVVDDGTP